MKKLLALVTIVWWYLPTSLFACEVCQDNQPEILRDVTHGIGPQGNTDYIIIWTAVVIVSVTLFLSIKYLVRPKESAPDHIKNITTE